jgi:hypothetical protein
MADAIQERERQFHTDVVKRFERAAPLLAELAQTLGDAVKPMVTLHSLAWRYRLPVPRLLAHVPALQEATRILVMFGNVGMAPAVPVSTHGDENELAGGL